MSPQQPLQFAAFSSAPDVGFWRELGRRKLHELGLNDAPIPVCARYEITAHGRSSCQAFVDCAAFVDPEQIKRDSPPDTHLLHGILVNTNTLEEFKSADKNGLMKRAAAELSAELELACPTKLNRMVVLTYADLKSHEYYYWFGFPVLAPATPFTSSAPIMLADALAPLSVEALRVAHEQAAIAVAAAKAAAVAGITSSHSPAERRADDISSFFVVRAHVRGLVVRAGESGVHGEEGAFEVGSLGRWSEWCEAAEAHGQPRPMLAFADPVAKGMHPGWPLRNLLMWARAQPHTPQTIQVICWRELSRLPHRAGAPAPATVESASLLLSVQLRPDAESGVDASSLPIAVGWERNTRGNLGARLVSMRSQLDPVALAEASVDLNLRLMKWRLLPQLHTERLAALRCLLIGAGTLGCNVARALMGWGVREIAFVDGGSVSHSNPVRQSLFTFADCAAREPRAKAVAAAEAVNGIFPGARATGHTLMVPMPGHPIAQVEEEGVRNAVAALEQLVERHDAVFLLTDTRESRWLPALLCAAHDKLAITAALGFDSYVVMRHGKGPAAAPQPLEQAVAAATAAGVAAAAAALPAEALHANDEAPRPRASATDAQTEASAASHRLGCYFCNDVVAPVDSTRDRTLDQQCTVTRPGLSMVASALAVEMLVSLVHHPLAHGAPADARDAEPSTPLGLVPHQVRGFLPTFRTELLSGQAFSCCVACSQRAVDRYRADGFDFLLRAFREPGFLEEFSGLKQLQQQAEAALEAWDGDDGADDGEDF